MASNIKVATFGAGCFWGVEELFRVLGGILETSSGYMGGSKAAPSYADVCSGKSGHAEVVHLTYDQEVISYTDLLELFFNNHNPTELNRQGLDVGSQYRSVIFYHDADQKHMAEKATALLASSARYKRPIVTQILQAQAYWPAEDYHQQYLAKRGLSSCHI